MANLIQGENTTTSLPAGYALTVTTGVVSTASVCRLSDSTGGEPYSPSSVAASSAPTFGPFATPTRWEVKCLTGMVLVSQAADIAAGGGASDFTDLTDAPATITAKGVVVGNFVGDALEMTNCIRVENGVAIIASQYGGETGDGQGGNVQIHAGGGAAEFDGGSIFIEAGTADDTGYGGDVSITAGNSVSGHRGSISMAGKDIVLDCDSGEGSLTLVHLDIPATDATATMTVDAVEYTIAKAIKVKIGSDTYCWPLFGPVTS